MCKTSALNLDASFKHLNQYCACHGARGKLVVEALCCNSEDRAFETNWIHWIVWIYQVLRSALSLRFTKPPTKMSNKREIQKCFRVLSVWGMNCLSSLKTRIASSNLIRDLNEFIYSVLVMSCAASGLAVSWVSDYSCRPCAWLWKCKTQQKFYNRLQHQ